MMLSGSTMSWDMPLSEYECSVFMTVGRELSITADLSHLM